MINSDKLTSFCFLLDAHHMHLFKKYKNALNLEEPECGFLGAEGYIPTDVDECYPCIEYSIKNILEIYHQLRLHIPVDIHNYLGILSYYLEEIEKYCEPVKRNHSAYESFKNILNYIKQGKKFLALYQYKETLFYQYNSAILFLTELMISVKSFQTINYETDIPLLKEKYSGTQLTLNQIAKLVCEATSRKPRDIQFIAIGIRNNNEPVITTNYHAPTIFRLSDVLDQTKFQEIERLRRQYKKNFNAKHLKYEGKGVMIHAETMLASLASLLDIKQIIIVDGEGRKKQNCAFCSRYLCEHGFNAESHEEIINNYNIPSPAQINDAFQWINYLGSSNRRPTKSETQNKYQFLGTLTSPKKAEKKADYSLYKEIYEMLDITAQKQFMMKNPNYLTFIFNKIKCDYPLQLNEVDGLKNTYHQSNKLAGPGESKIRRTLSRKGKNIVSKYKNDKLIFFDDQRLQVDTINKKIKPADPNSPRSRKLSNHINHWLVSSKHGHVTQNNADKTIEISRSVRSMN